MMLFTEVEANLEIKAVVEITLLVVAIKHVSIVVKATVGENVLHIVKMPKVQLGQPSQISLWKWQ